MLNSLLQELHVGLLQEIFKKIGVRLNIFQTLYLRWLNKKINITKCSILKSLHILYYVILSNISTYTCTNCKNDESNKHREHFTNQLY